MASANEWADVDLPSFKRDKDPVFVVNVGDCLTELSGGTLRSTLHGVIPPEDTPLWIPRPCPNASLVLLRSFPKFADLRCNFLPPPLLPPPVPSSSFFGLLEPRPRQVVLQLQLLRRQVRSSRLDGRPTFPVAVSPRPPPATGTTRSRFSPSPPPLPFQRFGSSPVFSIESLKRTFFVFARFSVAFDGSPLSARFERLPGLPAFRTAARLRGSRRLTGVFLALRRRTVPFGTGTPSPSLLDGRRRPSSGLDALPNCAVQTQISIVIRTPSHADFRTVPAGQALKGGRGRRGEQGGAALLTCSTKEGECGVRERECTDTGECGRSGRGPSFFSESR